MIIARTLTFTMRQRHGMMGLVLGWADFGGAWEAILDWAPTLAVTGDAAQVRVSASDVASTSGCGRQLALKVRPKVKSVDGWQKLWPEGSSTPFPLGDVVNIAVAFHRAPRPATYAEQNEWVEGQIASRGVHRLVRRYVRAGVDNLIEAHEMIEDEIGPLTLLRWAPEKGPLTRQLWAWAPLYGTVDGIREIRRFRLGSARAEQDEDASLWAATAAYLAATFSDSVPPTRIRVTEIGIVDGTVSIVLDTSPDEAVEAFSQNARDRARDLVMADHVQPGRACGECKAAGSCSALVPLNGVLGQTGRGHQSRSVAASHLETYRRCPAQWLLDSCLHLPKEEGQSDAVARGHAVHRWLELAHTRGHGCGTDDLPLPGTVLGLADGLLTEDEYASAFPYLQHHVGNCPLSDPDNTVIAVETNMYGYDHVADVTIVSRPDLVYRTSDNRLVIREFKSTAMPYGGGQDEAFERHLQIPFQVAAIDAGLASEHEAAGGVLELEVLTPTGRDVWSWDANDPVITAVARGEVRRAVASWHADATWTATPGPQCSWCPVARWCPDKDAWKPEVSSTEETDADDEPPF